MAVIETVLATSGTREAPPRAMRALIWVLTRLLPLANPDFEDRYPEVAKWWVEIDPAGVPRRELGLDADGRPIVAGPFGENFGFWTDSNMVFEAEEYPTVSSDLFEAAWSSFKSSHAPKSPKGG